MDRVAVLPDNYWIIVELKRPKGGKASWHQIREMATLSLLKARVYLAPTIAHVDDIFNDYDHYRRNAP